MTFTKRAQCTESSWYDMSSTMTQTPTRVPPWNRNGSVRSSVSVTHPNRTLMQEELKRPSPNWYTYTCSWFQMQINNNACGPQQPEKTTPKTRHYPTRDRAELPEPHQSNAKQLDVYNTSQPLPSSLTEVY